MIVASLLVEQSVQDRRGAERVAGRSEIVDQGRAGVVRQADRVRVHAGLGRPRHPDAALCREAAQARHHGKAVHPGRGRTHHPAGATGGAGSREPDGALGRVCGSELGRSDHGSARSESRHGVTDGIVRHNRSASAPCGLLKTHHEKEVWHLISAFSGAKPPSREPTTRPGSLRSAECRPRRHRRRSRPHQRGWPSRGSRRRSTTPCGAAPTATPARTRPGPA